MIGDEVEPGRSSTKVGGETQPDRRSEKWLFEQRVASGLLDLDKNAAYMQAVDVTEFRLLRREDGWLVMIKGVRRGHKLVSFMNAHRFCDALEMAATMTDCGYLHWKQDIPPPKWRVQP